MRSQRRISFLMGQFEPYQDIERETVKVNATMERTTSRTFGRDSNGAKTLVQVTEEERRSLPGGDSNVIRSTSNPDANGNLQLVQREVEATKIISKNIEETKTTVMLPGINGGLSPAMQVQERRERGAKDTVESQKTTLLSDGTGNWQVSETRHDITRQAARTAAPRSASPASTLKASWPKSLARSAGSPRPLPERNTTQRKPIPSMSQVRRGTAACIWSNASPPPSVPAQPASKPLNGKSSSPTPAILTPVCK
jgi:hypothetical protein